MHITFSHPENRVHIPDLDVTIGPDKPKPAIQIAGHAASYMMHEKKGWRVVIKSGVQGEIVSRQDKTLVRFEVRQ